MKQTRLRATCHCFPNLALQSPAATLLARMKAPLIVFCFTGNIYQNVEFSTLYIYDFKFNVFFTRRIVYASSKLATAVWYYY